jgi:superfamily II DNA/RNA helicase
LRILICTDAAREGINLQSYCSDLIHFDLPWNPSRLEQRNGRIDRKLQPAKQIFCRYFRYEQREADIVLEALVRKTETIREQLGSVGQVIEDRVAKRLAEGGIVRGQAAVSLGSRGVSQCPRHLRVHHRDQKRRRRAGDSSGRNHRRTGVIYQIIEKDGKFSSKPVEHGLLIKPHGSIELTPTAPKEESASAQVSK